MFQGGAARAALLLVAMLTVMAHGKPPDRPVDVSSAVLEMGPEEQLEDLGEGTSSIPGGQVKWCQEGHDKACKEQGKCGNSKITGVGKCGERLWCTEGVNGDCYDSSEALFKAWSKQTRENCLSWAKNKDLPAPQKKLVLGTGTCAQRVNGITCGNVCGKPIVAASSLPAKKQQSVRLVEKTKMRLDNYTIVLSMKSTSSSIGHENAKGNVTCGDGKRQGTEQCDDGNSDDGDGCSKTCKVEGGFACDTKVEGDVGDRCYGCKATQCTILYDKSFRCMSTKPSKEKLKKEKILRRRCIEWKRKRDILLKKKKLTKKASALLMQWRAKKMNKQCVKVFQQKSPMKHSFRRQLRHVRGSNGFCQCAPGFCSEDGANCKRVGDGWYRDPESGKCTCGLGFCLLPFATQTLASPNKYHCAKVNKNMIRSTNSSLCQCAPGHDAVVSDDPVKARALRGPACKAVPSTPVKIVKHQGAMFAQFTCMGAPYVKGNTTETCDDCAPTACKMMRPGVLVSHVNKSSANQTNPFYCVSKTVMEQMQMVRDAGGICKCSKDECLKPHRDSFKCVPLTGSHPYGGVKLKDGKCGCTDDADSCIMPTHPAGFGSPGKGFQCLKLKDGGAKTHFGKHYFRGKTGLCKCLPSRCRAGPSPSGVGSFKCLDVEKNSAYRLDPALLAAVKAGTSKEEDVPCQCAKGACTVPVPGQAMHDCIKCPTKPGACRVRCSPDGSACVKYCSTKHVKLIHAPGSGISMDKKTGKIARVIRCFITKNVKCVDAPASGAANKNALTKGKKKCEQKISARVEFDCPGKYSAHSNRKLMDGTQTYGFKSVCSRQNYECQRAKCDTTAPAAVCLEKMMLT